MSKSKSLPVLVLGVGALLVQPADAATVRRHVHCTTVAGGITITFLIPTTTPGIASITNNWSTPIPAGAAFTLTVAGRHPRTFTLPQETCDASYLDTGYQLGGPPPSPQPKKPKFPALPKQGSSPRTEPRAPASNI